MDKYIAPDFRHCAVLTIDMQNDFALPGATAEIEGTFKIVPVISELLHICRIKTMPIIHVIRLYKADGSNVDNCRRSLVQSGSSIVRPGSQGAELVHELSPENPVSVDNDSLLNGNIAEIAANEWMLYKPRWGAFYQTRLEQFLKDKGINTLIFTGCNFPNCPRTSIYEASERDFRIVLVGDAVSGLFETGLTEMKKIGVCVSSSIDVQRQL